MTFEGLWKAFKKAMVPVPTRNLCGSVKAMQQSGLGFIDVTDAECVSGMFRGLRKFRFPQSNEI